MTEEEIHALLWRRGERGEENPQKVFSLLFYIFFKEKGKYHGDTVPEGGVEVQGLEGHALWTVDAQGVGGDAEKGGPNSGHQVLVYAQLGEPQEVGMPGRMNCPEASGWRESKGERGREGEEG